MSPFHQLRTEIQELRLGPLNNKMLTIIYTSCFVIIDYYNLPIKNIKTKQLLLINDSFFFLTETFMRVQYDDPQGPSKSEVC